MNIILATPEAVPFAKTGGLADVTGALVGELRRLKAGAFLMMPLYAEVKERFEVKDTGLEIKVPVGSREIKGRIYSYGDYAFFIGADEFFSRRELYGLPSGDYPDNDLRFIFFARGVLEAAKALGLRPDIIHANDWQSALAPLYLKTAYSGDRFFERTKTVLTIHNLGYQGVFPPSAVLSIGLGWSLFGINGFEFYGKVNFLKAGIISADFITTVSRTYAEEILESRNGFGLDGVLAGRKSALAGIPNGIDLNEWSPEKDGMIPSRYGAGDMSGKKRCKGGLVRECSFGKKQAPIIGLVGRLSEQKGVDIFLESVDGILALGANVVVLGKGDLKYQEALRTASKKHHGRLFVNIGIDEKFAHLVYAGSDIFLMPSRYEPCGLGQIISQRYGTLPVARSTGGLKDTIEDYSPLKGTGTGFLFGDYSPSALKEAVKTALCAYSDEKKWGALVLNAMRKDFSWRSSARQYLALFRRLGRKGAL